MAPIQEEYESVTLMEHDSDATVTSTSRRALGRKVGGCAAIMGAVGLVACALRTSTSINPSPEMPPMMEANSLLQGESLQAYEALERRLVDPDATIPLPDDPTAGIDDESLYHLECAVDVTFMITYTSQAVLAIEKALKYTDAVCKEDNSYNSGCAIYVEIAILLLLWVGCYIALAIDSCASTVTPAVLCAADVTGLLASLVEAIYVGTALSLDCDFSPELTPLLPPAIFHPKNTTSRASILQRLRGHSGDEKMHGGSSSSKWQSDSKSVGADLLHSHISKSGMSNLMKNHYGHSQEEDHSLIGLLRNMSEDRAARRQENFERNIDRTACVMEGLSAVGCFMGAMRIILSTAKEGCKDPKGCALSIIGAVGYFGWMVQTISAMFSDCPREYNQHAACTADIAELTGITGFIAVYCAVIGDDCKATEHGNDVPAQELMEDATSRQRRLAYEGEEEEEEEEE